MKKKYLMIFTLLAIIGVFLFIFLNKIPTTAINQRFNVPSSVGNAAPYGNNSLVYSNGQSLVVYGISQGQVNRLSPPNGGLGSIDTVSVTDDSNYIVFHDTQAQAGGILYNQLSTANLNPYIDYWWMYSIKTGTFQFLPNKTVFAKATGSNIYSLTPGNSNEVLTTYNPTGLVAQSAISVIGSTDVFPSQGGFYLQTPKNQIVYTKDGSVNQVVINSAKIVGANQAFLVAVESSNSSRELVKYNISGNSLKNVASNIQGDPAWLNSGFVLYTSGKSTSSSNPNIYQYDLTTNKIFKWALASGISNFGVAGPTISILASPTSAIISSNTSTYYIVGNQIANPSNISF